MPVLESTNHITSRGAARRPAIAKGEQQEQQDQLGQEVKAEKETRQEKHTSEPEDIVRIIKRASRKPLQPLHTDQVAERTRQTEGDEEVHEWKRGGKEARADKAKPAITDDPAQVASTAQKLKRLPRQKISVKRDGTWHAHPYFFLGIGMVAMLVLWMLLTMAASWWSVTWDNLHYGYPRTYQVDAVVGHNDSASNPSHFIAINLNGRIEIIEFPGGDGSKARIYIGPQLYGNGENLIPVTLSFVDVSGNHLPDMILHFQNTQIVFINENGGFRPATSSELPAIENYLKLHGQ